MLYASSISEHLQSFKQPHEHCIAFMSRPVRPPILPSELDRAGPVLLRAELAEVVTLDKPSEAFELAPETFSFALEADEDTAFAASEVVEACRTGVLRRARREGHDASRTVVADMLYTVTCVVTGRATAATASECTYERNVRR